jgi:putative DNA primase/helicase
MTDKAEADPYVAKIKADFAVEQQHRREAEAKKVVPLLAQSEKARTDYLNSLAEKPKAKDEPPKDEKPEIELGGADSARLGEIVATAMGYLASSSGTKIYQRGGRLMRPLTEPVIVNGEPLRVGELVELNDRFLKMVLMRRIRWSRRTKEGKRYVNPGYEIGKLILALRGVWPFPTVTGVINAPTLRRDGSLLCQEGYDAATGLLLLNSPRVSIKMQPTRADAEAAIETLRGLISETPFVDAAGRAVALSLIISAVIRGGALETAPLHLFVSPASGSGKSYVVEIAHLIATGEGCAVQAATKDMEEMEKRLVPKLMAGRALVSLDNLSGELASDLLCQAITQPMVSLRPLGKSEDVRVVTRSVFAATGNNLAIADDLGRRTIMARLDAGMERVWDREFSQQPLEMIAADRAKFVGAALTIPLAYVAAGFPDLPPDLNGFKQWSRLVRAALMWLGEPDPVSTMEIARGGDARLQAKGAVFAAMADLFGLGEAVARTAAQIIEGTATEFDGAISMKEILSARTTRTPQQNDLIEALREVAAQRKAYDVTSGTLGNWLRDWQDQIVGGLRLRSKADRTRLKHWWIEQVKEQTGDGG